jgi:hypothetical protein
MTCNIAIQAPSVNKVKLKNIKQGETTKTNEATVININENDKSAFSQYFSDKNPAGMDMTP